tara:strand:+ start:581 stop:1003 length:423 start_codon:yes stop_codon:yes gene_type:complete
MSSYQVGQILYLIQSQSLAVIPVQVAEQITKNTLEGSETIYNVRLPKKDQLVSLKSFDGEVFEDLEAVKVHLLSNAQKSILELIDQADKIAQKFFNKAPTRPIETVSLDEVSSEDIVQVELDDGKVANLRLPSEITGASK